jgi:ATP-dependent helicase HepA
VGLGKTNEAGLILHRLHITGRAGRILILLPPALLNQWFVEMFRRFQMSFSIFDEDRCASLELEGANPFLDSQLVICALDFLSKNPKRAAQAREAGWDLLVVDEAHHLQWSPTEAGPEYQLVESLAVAASSLLLLTATPQQLGMEGHFARLRLLDPNRYDDLDAFLKESDHYESVAKSIDALLAGKKIPNTSIFKGTRVAGHYAEFLAGDVSARDRVVAALLDEYGTGRVIFRNTRAALSGFPKRKAHLAPLAPESDETAAKIPWLIALLKEHKKVSQPASDVDKSEGNLRRELCKDKGIRRLAGGVVGNSCPERRSIRCKESEQGNCKDPPWHRGSKRKSCGEGQQCVHRLP